jgi:hypothetical protein
VGRQETIADFEALGHRAMKAEKAILAKCKWCSDGYSDRINCLVTDCPLYPFRLGKNPWRKPKTERQLASARALTGKRKSKRSVGTANTTGAPLGGQTQTDAAPMNPI